MTLRGKFLGMWVTGKHSVEMDMSWVVLCESGVLGFIVDDRVLREREMEVHIEGGFIFSVDDIGGGVIDEVGVGV